MKTPKCCTRCTKPAAELFGVPGISIDLWCAGCCERVLVEVAAFPAEVKAWLGMAR